MSTRNIEDAYPLSPMQEGMLFHNLYAPESGVYVTQVACRLHALDVTTFTRVWQQLIDRQTILRSAFVWKNVEKPLQVVGRQVGLVLERQDWRGLAPDVQGERFESYLEADRRAGFNLMKAPAMRLSLFQLDGQDYQFLWTHHHILMDGWSVSLLLSDFFNLYKAASRGEDHYAEPRRPYRDYIRWLQQQNLGDAERFWRHTLKGFTDPTYLGIELKGADGKAPPAQSQNYEERHVNLSEDTTAGLQRLARDRQVTLNTVVQGAWALLLSRYSGSYDVVFGATVSGRPASLPGVEGMIGLFINTLPVRVRVRGDEVIGEYLRRIQEQQVEVRQYEHSPLVEVQGWSEVPRGRPLFESILVFENYPITETLKEGNRDLEVSGVRSVERNNYPLALVAMPGACLRLNLIYDSDRYDAASVERLLQHLSTLLNSVAVNTKRRLEDLSLLTPAEERHVLLDWNATAADFPPSSFVHQLFEQQAGRTPDAVAVVYEDEQLSYRELNERANQLAHYLMSVGVGLETLVGICLERSVSMVVGLLGILKAGGAYVPLDPDYPQDRLSFMLEDSGVKVLLSEQSVAERLPASLAAPVLFLDGAAERLAVYSDANPVCKTLPDNLAYLIYTSGSTGRPKGAMNSHRAVCNRLMWMQEAYGLDASDRVLQKTPFSFDVSVWEFFWPLMTGARLVVARPHGHQDSAYLISLILGQRITTLHFVPSMLQVFLEERGVGRCAESLRRVVCSGEAMTPSLQERFFERLGGVELENLYGPTEAAIDVTHWHCLRGRELSSVPIGWPIANLEMYVLDGRLRPQPPGVKGELYIGGVGLGRGYINRAGQTAEKFIPNPFGREPGARLYRTGDLARYLPGGEIEYLGRVDHQVKVRGFRIELGEIEAALARHERVREAAVIVTEDAGGHKRLVAYVVNHGDGLEELGVGELRRHLGEKLPEYMVPSVFVTLDSLPLTPNGKVDRKALPAPDDSRPNSAGEYVAPSTPVEQALTDIWCKVLGRERVGVHDNFFDLGGHSLLVLQVQRKIREAFDRELPLIEMFRHPTIHLLAARLKREADGTAETASPLRGLERAETRKALINRRREAGRRNPAAK